VLGVMEPAGVDMADRSKSRARIDAHRERRQLLLELIQIMQSTPVFSTPRVLSLFELLEMAMPILLSGFELLNIGGRHVFLRRSLFKRGVRRFSRNYQL
jgi:hypothetical protein